jgi:excisionase family DNA binding protein
MEKKRQEWDVNRVAREKNVSTITVRRWIASGRLPAHRVGPKLIRVWSDDLDRVNQPVGGAA